MCGGAAAGDAASACRDAGPAQGAAAPCPAPWVVPSEVAACPPVPQACQGGAKSAALQAEPMPNPGRLATQPVQGTEARNASSAQQAHLALPSSLAEGLVAAPGGSMAPVVASAVVVAASAPGRARHLASAAAGWQSRAQAEVILLAPPLLGIAAAVVAAAVVAAVIVVAAVAAPAALQVAARPAPPLMAAAADLLLRLPATPLVVVAAAAPEPLPRLLEPPLQRVMPQ